MKKRKVLIYSTQGKTQFTVETDVEQWKELKEILINEGYNMDSLKATENITRTNLEVGSAVLPAEDFTLFLRPVKTKSGAGFDNLSFKELRAECKILFNSDKGKDFSAFVKRYGNYTRLSTETLREILTKYSQEESNTDKVSISDLEKEAKELFGE